MNKTKITPIQKRILKILTWGIGIFLVLLLILQLLFELNKDKLKDYIVSSFNQVQNGEITIGSISLSPLYHLPDITIQLDNISLYETKDYRNRENEQAVGRLHRFYIILDILSLLSGDLDVSELAAEDGNINIVAREDSTINLINLLKTEKDSVSVEDEETAKTMALQLNKFTLKNISLRYDNQLTRYRADVQIKRLENVFTIIGQRLDIQLHPQINIIQIEKDNYRFLHNTQLQMSLNLDMDLSSGRGNIHASRISIEGANLNLDGEFNLDDSSFFDLHLSSSINDPSLLFLFFDEEIIRNNLENLKAGNIYFEGTVRGNIAQGFPFTELKFGIKNLHLKDPETGREVKRFGFDGYFTTGKKKNHSDAELTLTNIYIDGMAGRSTGEIGMRNFEKPIIRLRMNAAIDLTHIERILRFIDSPVYSGIARIRADTHASYNNHLKKIINAEGEVDLSIEDCSFLIANTGKVSNHLSADIRLTNNTIIIENLKLESAGVDLLLNGELTNLVSHFLGFETDVSANLVLHADSLDFNTFLTSDDVGQWILDEYCRDVDVNIRFDSNSEKLKQVSELPSGQLYFNHLRMRLKNVSDLTIEEGEVTISPELLDFKKMRAIVENNRLFFSGSIRNYADLFANDFQDSCLISIDLHSGHLVLKDFFTYKNSNYLPDFWSENSYNDFNLNASLTLPEDADSLIEPDYEFKVNIKNVNGVNTKNTAILKNITANVKQTREDLVFRNFGGRIGNSEFDHTTIYLNDLFAEDKKLKIRAELNGDLLDIKEWLNYISVSDSSEVDSSIDRTTSPYSSYQTAIPMLDISAKFGELRYDENSMYNLRTTVLTQKENYFYIDPQDNTWWIPQIVLTAQIDSDTLKTFIFRVPEVSYSIIAQDERIEIIPRHKGLLGAAGEGHIWIDLSEKQHRYHLQYAINNYKIETFLKRFNQGQRMGGTVQMFIDLNLQQENLSGLNGIFNLSGENLIVYNIDIDEVLTRFKRTQNFNLVDIGAFLLAGPAGAVITKASDYAILLNFDPTKQSIIAGLQSSWKINAGVFMADDVAFTTPKSRIALRGGIDLYKNQFVDFTLAVVDEKGCPLVSQTITGSLSQPQFQKINAVTTILAPVTNILKLIAGADCTPFYTGSLPHPSGK